MSKYSIRFFVDWNNDGDFSDSLEDISADVITATWGYGRRTPFQGMPVSPYAEIVVKNEGGKYTPENAASPIYPNLTVGRRVAIGFNNALDMTNMLYFGVLDWPQLNWQGGGSVIPTVNLYTINDAWNKLVTNEMQAGGSATGHLIKDVLSDLGMMTISSEAFIDAGATYGGTINLPRMRAIDVISNALTAENGQSWFNIRPYYDAIQPFLGTIYVGEFHQWNTLDVEYAGGSVAAGTISTQNNPVYHKPIALDYALGQYLANTFKATSVNSGGGGGTEILWSSNQAIYVDAGGTLTFDARMYGSKGAVVSASSISVPRTFSQGTAALGGSTTGDTVTIILTNAGTIPAICNSLRILGVPVFADSESDFELTLQALVNTYGIKTYNMRSFLFLGRNSADWAVAYEGQRRQTPLAHINSVTCRYSLDDDRLLESREWFRVIISNLAHNELYREIGQEWTYQNGYIDITRYLERYVPVTVKPKT